MKNKTSERSRILTLYRRGAIDDATFDAQSKEIELEETELSRQIDEIENKRGSDAHEAPNLATVESLLRRLGKGLDQGLPWERRRRLMRFWWAKYA